MQKKRKKTKTMTVPRSIVSLPPLNEPLTVFSPILLSVRFSSRTAPFFSCHPFPLSFLTRQSLLPLMFPSSDDRLLFNYLLRAHKWCRFRRSTSLPLFVSLESRHSTLDAHEAARGETRVIEECVYKRGEN